MFKGILNTGNSSGENIMSRSAASENNAPGEVKKGWLSNKMRVFKQLESPGQHLVQKGKRRMGSVVDNPSEAESRGGLDVLILFSQSLEDGPDKNNKHLVLAVTAQFGGEKSNRVDADIPDDRVGIPEALDDACNHFGKMRKDQAIVVGGQRSHQSYALLSDGGFLLPVGV